MNIIPIYSPKPLLVKAPMTAVKKKGQAEEIRTNRTCVI